MNQDPPRNGDATLGPPNPSQEIAGGSPGASCGDSAETEGPGSRAGARGFHRGIATVTRLALLVLGVTAFLHWARPVVLPVVVAWVVATGLNPLMRGLRAWRLPGPLAAILVMAVVFIPVSFAFSQLSRPMVEWFEKAPENLGRLKGRLRSVLKPARYITEVASNMGKAAIQAENPGAISQVEVHDHAFAGTVFSWTATALVGMGETLALIFLLLSAEDTFIQKLVKVMPTLRDKRRAVEITREIRHSVSGYLFTVGLVNLGLGAVLAIALQLIGMPEPFMWGALAALANCIPYFGPFLGMGLVAIGGLTAFETAGRGLLPAGVYLGLHLLEANLVTPLLLGRQFTLNPVIVFASLIFFVWLWGGVGALVAMPVLVATKIVCDRVPLLAPVGEILSD